MKRTNPMPASVLFACITMIGCSESAQQTTDQSETETAAATTPESDTMTSEPTGAVPAETVSSDSVLAGITMDRLTGGAESLDTYHGDVVLVVNTASKCGYTGQYDGLQKIYDQYKDQGFVVLGFPANDFGGQEPGTEEEIGEFCRINYGVEFPMFAKTSVLGEDCNPLHDRLRALPAPLGGEPRWNFTKFLIDRQGNVVARFESAAEPESQEVISQIETLLGA